MWAGWGAGTSGAGATGGATRIFHLLAMCGTAIVAVVLFLDRKWPTALAATAVAFYFALRLFYGLGRRG